MYVLTQITTPKYPYVQRSLPYMTPNLPLPGEFRSYVDLAKQEKRAKTRNRNQHQYQQQQQQQQQSHVSQCQFQDHNKQRHHLGSKQGLRKGLSKTAFNSMIITYVRFISIHCILCFN
jgi:hypothetical protein